MSNALQKGMVLVMSLWDHQYSGMAWLDSTWPREKPDAPGAKIGEYPVGKVAPKTAKSEQASAKVIFSNIKFGELNSTFSAGS